MGLGLLSHKKSQKRKVKDFEKKGLTILAEQEEAQRVALGEQERGARRGLTDAITAFDDAKKELAISGRSAKQDIQASGQLALGGSLQHLVDSGSFSGSAVTSAQRAVGGDLARAASRVDVDLGEQFASLAMERQQAVRQAREVVSEVHRRRGAVSADMAQSYLNLIAAVTNARLSISQANVNNILGVVQGASSLMSGFGSL